MQTIDNLVVGTSFDDVVVVHTGNDDGIDLDEESGAGEASNRLLLGLKEEGSRFDAEGTIVADKVEIKDGGAVQQ